MKKYKAALISLGSKSSKMTLEAMKKYFLEVDNINIKKLEVNPNLLKITRVIIAVKSSTIGYTIDILSLQFEHLPRKNI